MNEYREISMNKMVDLAQTSCAELGATGGNWVVNYETGKPFEAPDYDTALFLASAREIVLELARRIEIYQDQYGQMSKFQFKTLRAAKGEHGTSIHMSRESEVRQADEMVTEGLLTKSLNDRVGDGRHYFFFITLKGRQVLSQLELDDRFTS